MVCLVCVSVLCVCDCLRLFEQARWLSTGASCVCVCAAKWQYVCKWVSGKYGRIRQCVLISLGQWIYRERIDLREQVNETRWCCSPRCWQRSAWMLAHICKRCAFGVEFYMFPVRASPVIACFIYVFFCFIAFVGLQYLIILILRLGLSRTWSACDWSHWFAGQRLSVLMVIHTQNFKVHIPSMI